MDRSVGNRGRSRALLAVLTACVALLGGAAWWLFVAQPVAPIDSQGGLPLQAAAGVDSAGAAASADEAGAPEARPPALAEPVAPGVAPRRRELPVAGRGIAPPADSGPRLRVVDATRGEPIADAEVALLELGGVPRSELAVRWRLAQRAEESGKRVRSDAAGRVALKVKRGDLFAVGRTRDRYGMIGVQASQHDTELRLFVDGPIEVLAHDAQGAALAGLPLALAYYHESSGAFERCALAISDAQGRAAFEHGRAWLEMVRPVGLLVLADGVFGELVKREVTLDDLGAPVPLPAPSFGTVTVKVLDFEDREVKSGASVKPLAPGVVKPVRAAPSDGRFRFAAVEVGLAARFSAMLYGERVGPIEGTARVSRPGEEVELVLGGASSVPVLALRVLDEQGAPLAAQTLQVQLAAPLAGASPHLVSPVTTDAEGRLKLFLAGWSAGGGALRLIAHASGERTLRTALVEVPVALRLGEQTLGDVQLVGLPFLASGRVVDQIGEPIANANVNVLGFNSDGKSWRDMGVAALSDADGRFWIEAELPATELFLRASAGDCQRGAPLSFARGARGVELSLERWASLEVVALLHQELEPQDLSVTWTVVDVAANTRQTFSLGPSVLQRPDGLRWVAYRDGKLRAGRGTLEIRALTTPVEVFEDVELRPGPNPGLFAELDLRDVVRILNLSIRDQSGREVEAGEIRFRASGSEEPWLPCRFTKGRARILALAPELDLSVFGAPGRATLFERVRSDATLVLDGPLWARVELEGGNPVRAPDTLRLAFTLVDARGAEVAQVVHSTWEALLDEDGRARVAFAAPGTYSVTFRLGCAATKKRAELPQRVEIEVESTESEQSFALAPPRAALEAKLQELALGGGR